MKKIPTRGNTREDSFDESQILVHFDNDKPVNEPSESDPYQPSSDKSSLSSSEISSTSSLTSCTSYDSYSDDDSEMEIEDLGSVSQFAIKKDSFTLLKNLKMLGVDESDLESSGLLIEEHDKAAVKDEEPFKTTAKRFTFTQKIVFVSLIVFVTIKLVALNQSP